MTESDGRSAGGKELLQLRVEYWSKRLDHTLTHTQTSSRLIYVIDGAVLALVYFSVQTLGATRPVILVASFPTLLLAALNGLHARLLESQRSWYSRIDTKLRDLLEVAEVQHTQSGSTHGAYRSMHVLIACFLSLAALAMLFYGLGHFPDLVAPQREGCG